MIDLNITTEGTESIVNDTWWEVGVRRLFAVQMADVDKNWRRAETIEELPAIYGPSIPERMQKDVLKTLDLQLRTEKAVKGQVSQSSKDD